MILRHYRKVCELHGIVYEQCRCRTLDKETRYVHCMLEVCMGINPDIVTHLEEESAAWEERVRERDRERESGKDQENK